MVSVGVRQIPHGEWQSVMEPHAAGGSDLSTTQAVMQAAGVPATAASTPRVSPATGQGVDDALSRWIPAPSSCIKSCVRLYAGFSVRGQTGSRRQFFQ